MRVSLAGSSLLPRIEQLWLALIVFLLPTQFGRHFWPDSALVYGIRVDYLAPTLYALDLLLLGYLVLKILNSKFEIRFLSPLFPILLTNLVFSHNPLATLSWSLHFVLYSVFVFTAFPSSPRSILKRTSHMVSLPPFKILNSKFKIIKVLLSLAILFQVALALAQVIMGHSVGGLMYYLGERTVSVGQPSIALATFMGETVLRAYGTFGHPNVLAGWLLITCLIVLRLVRLQSPKRANNVPSEGLTLKDAPTPNVVREGQTLWIPLSPKILNSKFEIGLLTLSTLGIFLTQSRAALFALLGLVIPVHFLRASRTRALYVLVVALFVIRYSVFTPPRSDLSISERLSLQKVSALAIGHWPLFGTGASASIATYPELDQSIRLLQPDHDSLTLLLSWFGLFGVLAIMYYLKNCLEFDCWNLIIIMPLLLLDHYLLTSPQGLLILLLYIRATITRVPQSSTIDQ